MRFLRLLMADMGITTQSAITIMRINPNIDYKKLTFAWKNNHRLYDDDTDREFVEQVTDAVLTIAAARLKFTGVNHVERTQRTEAVLDAAA
jgi:hypothetical protein